MAWRFEDSLDKGFWQRGVALQRTRLDLWPFLIPPACLSVCLSVCLCRAVNPLTTTTTKPALHDNAPRGSFARGDVKPIDWNKFDTALSTSTLGRGKPMLNPRVLVTFTHTWCFWVPKWTPRRRIIFARPSRCEQSYSSIPKTTGDVQNWMCIRPRGLVRLLL